MANQVTVNTDEINRMIGQVQALESMDFSPLMEDWRVVLEQDNEANLGIDKHGISLEPVTYRPDSKAGTRKSIDYEHINPYDNLHSSHYRILEGPPLSPRGLDSRMTQFFRTSWDRDEPKEGDWRTVGMWEDFKSIGGEDILPFHAAGDEHNPNLPVRDVLGVRPSALMQARDALVSFVNKLLGR